jgi:hypothetical protein
LSFPKGICFVIPEGNLLCHSRRESALSFPKGICFVIPEGNLRLLLLLPLPLLLLFWLSSRRDLLLARAAAATGANH